MKHGSKTFTALRSRKAGFAWVVLHVILPLILLLLIVYLLFSKTGLFSGLKEKLKLIFNKHLPEFITYKGVVFEGVNKKPVMDGFVQFINTLRSYQDYTQSKAFNQQNLCIAGYYFPKSFISSINGGHYSIEVGKTSNGIGVMLYKGVKPALKDGVINIETTASLCLIPGRKLYDCLSNYASSYACSFTETLDVNTLWIGSETSFKHVIKQSGIKTRIVRIENKDDILAVMFLPGRICFVTEYDDKILHPGCNKKSEPDKSLLFDTDCHRYLRAAFPSCNEEVSCDLPKGKDNCEHYLRDQCEACNNGKCKLKAKGSGFLGLGSKVFPICS